MKKFEIPGEIEKELQKKGGWNNVKRSLPLKEIKEVEKVMRVLSCGIRLKILYALSEQRMCVCMLTELTNCPYSKCSYHISKLKDMGLVSRDERGRYRVVEKVDIGVLKMFVMIGGRLIPRMIFYAVFITTLLILYLARNIPSPDPHAAALGILASLFLWIETIRLWRHRLW